MVPSFRTQQNATRGKLTEHIAVGLIVLFYDHCLTFADEVEYIWTAPATYAKYTFLLNRYAGLGTLLAVAYGMSNNIPDILQFQLNAQIW